MAYVLTESQTKLCRCPQDRQSFENNWFKRVQRTMDIREAPKAYERKVDDSGRPFTVVLHAVTREVLEVL